MDDRREPDDDVETEARARYEAEKKRVAQANAAGLGSFFATPLSTHRKQVIQEHRDAQEARIRDLQEQALRQPVAPDEVPIGETPLQVSDPYPREQLGIVVTHLVNKTATQREIAKETGIKRGSRLNRLVRYVRSGELGFDDHGQLRYPAGTRFNASGDVIFP